MPIKVFYHVAPMVDWESVVREQGNLLQASGLAAAAENIYVCWAGKAREADEKQVASMIAPKARIVYWSNLQQYEFPALHMLWHKTETGDRVLYMHTKGVSHKTPHRKGSDEWRRFLGWGCIERWRECLAALDDVDMAGVQWTRLDPHYAELCGQPWVWAGNFWWARGEYIKRLPVCEFSENRWRAEGWVAQGKPKVVDLYNLTQGQPIRGLPNPTGPNVQGFGRHCYTKDPPLVVSSTVQEDYDREWPMKARFDVLNAIIARRGYKCYLEIGYEFGNCYRRINCGYKESVDPNPSVHATHIMTSDAYFDMMRSTRPNDKWDIIFIDGLHERDQVIRDVENALEFLTPWGCLLLHDCQPETPFQARNIPAYDGKGMWTGNVWEAWARLRMTRPDLRMMLIDVDCGCGYIDRGGQECYKDQPLSWRLYWRERVPMMNRVSVKRFAEFLEEMHDVGSQRRS